MDYKIQGQSLTNVIIDLEGCCSLQSVYVMLSHAKSMRGIAILQWFSCSKIYRKLQQQFRDEFARLDNLDFGTKETFVNRSVPEQHY
jgi:hypothetical protein